MTITSNVRIKIRLDKNTLARPTTGSGGEAGERNVSLISSSVICRDNVFRFNEHPVPRARDAVADNADVRSATNT